MRRTILLLPVFTAMVFCPTANAKSPKLSLTIPTQAAAGQSASLQAKLTPARKSVKVTVQEKLSGKWINRASAKTSAKGKATISVSLPAGNHWVRASAKVGKKKLFSPEGTLTVTAAQGDGNQPSDGTQDNPDPGPLFTPPGRDMSGTDAADYIVPYLTNSTFTDCPAGWPACAVEYRYGHFASGEMYYCRLTNTSGSDIINGAHPYQIIGAEVKADGSWGVSLQVLSYGDQPTYYNWQVSTAGVAYGAYWGPGHSPYAEPGNPSESIGPLQWVRGARSCSY